WTFYNYLTLWIGMAHNIPTYMMAGGFIALGMSWWEALLTVFLGNMIVLVPILLNAVPGTMYGIPFPVYARASFGIRGANVPALLRALVAAGWFGIESAIGGSAMQMFLLKLIPWWGSFSRSGSFLGQNVGQWITFMLFWSFNIWVIFHGMRAVKRFEAWAGPLVLALGVGLLIWAYTAAHGFGPLLHEAGTLKTPAAFFAVFIPSLTGVVGFWSTLSLNIPDFSRFSRSQRDQLWGQTVGLPTTMVAFSGIGVLVTSASIVIFGHAISDPINLLGHFNNPWVIIVSLVAIVVATLSVNIAANVVSPAYDFIQLFPRHLNFPKAGLLTGILGIVMLPWLLLSNPHVYIFDWLDIYSGFLGPIAAILIADFWLVRKKHLNVDALYADHAQYWYHKGYNPKALIALAAGIGIALVGTVVPSLHWLYSYSWFVGFGLSFIVYGFLMRLGQDTRNM
ncbi:MAG: NCS1 family nucleobase:cation symporter-1, partial [Firmicutes bacterium]|nr:NCS1 family nucleobase:cation symporter-1 [Bacillota bacterium]